ARPRPSRRRAAGQPLRLDVDRRGPRAGSRVDGGRKRVTTSSNGTSVERTDAPALFVQDIEGRTDTTARSPVVVAERAWRSVSARAMLRAAGRVLLASIVVL